MSADAALPCVFCQIIAGAKPATRVHEDDATMAILDIRPVAPGHTLLIPRQHCARLHDLSPQGSAAFYRSLHTVTRAVVQIGGAPALTILINDGRDAGQEVPHLHVHLIPRRPNDGRRIRLAASEPQRGTRAGGR